MPALFQSSPNVLFETEVRQVSRLSPSFLRVTLTGAHLHRFAAHGLDQRIKILVPIGAYPATFDDDLLHESEWRRRWRELPPTDRPALRSYTTSAVRPDLREIDLDFYVHARPGPASSWAVGAGVGQRLLVSGPSSRLSDRRHGIQWSPGMATHLLLAGDETAFPAIRGIVSALHPTSRATVILEVGDPRDAAWITAEIQGHTVTVLRREPSGGEPALLRALEDWCGQSGAAAAALGTDFYAWMATESSQVSKLRTVVQEAGIAPGRVHSQGYWNDGARTSLD